MNSTSSCRQRNFSWPVYLKNEAVSIFLVRFPLFALCFTLVVTVSIIANSKAIRMYTYSDWEFPTSIIPNYPPVDLEYANYTVLFDGHSHTSLSDGTLSPEKNIQWHIAYGYQAFVVTDHNNLLGAIETQRIAREKYDDKVKVLVGTEWTNCRVHMNFVGITTQFPNRNYPSDEEIRDTITEVHRQGGIAVINHIPWSLNQAHLSPHPSREQLLEWGIDYIEAINGDGVDLQSIIFAKHNSIGVMVGTDMHYPNPVNGWLVMKPENFSEEAIMEALRRRENSFIYDAVNSPFVGRSNAERNSAHLFWSPFLYFYRFVGSYYYYYTPMYSFNQGYCGATATIVFWDDFFVLVAWVLIGFVIYNLLHSALVLLWKKLQLCYRFQQSPLTGKCRKHSWCYKFSLFCFFDNKEIEDEIVQVQLLNMTVDDVENN